MNERKPLREIEALRLEMQMNNRLRLETLAALSKVFREFGVQITDDLLRSITFAVQEELPGHASFAQPTALAVADEPPSPKPPPPTEPPPAVPPLTEPPPAHPPYQTALKADAGKRPSVEALHASEL